MHAAPASLLAIDLRWLDQPRSIAMYVLRGECGVALIEPGPASTLETARESLRAIGVEPHDVTDVLVTHVHLDHAGAAWWWAQHGGTASKRPRVHVHHFGAKHLVDPSKLVASAQRIYGESMQRLWGELHPIDASLVRALHDSDVIDAAGHCVTVIETPGHARHHHSFSLELNGERLCFTGDVAAMNVAGREFISLPTPPPEFDPPQWKKSLSRLSAQRFDALYLTHFGRIDAAEAHLRAVACAIETHFAVVRRLHARNALPTEIVATYTRWLRGHATAAGLTPAEIVRHVSPALMQMNVTGMLRFLGPSA